MDDRTNTILWDLSKMLREKLASVRWMLLWVNILLVVNVVAMVIVVHRAGVHLI